MARFQSLRLAGPPGFTIIEESGDGMTLCRVEEIREIEWQSLQSAIDHRR